MNDLAKNMNCLALLLYISTENLNWTNLKVTKDLIYLRSIVRNFEIVVMYYLYL